VRSYSILVSLAKPVTMVNGATLTVASPKSSVAGQGTIVGAFRYMSPEQVEGKELDGRSDIFSLGAALYEMLTGQLAFEGKSLVSVASAILEREPTPINSIKPLTPPALDHAIRRCLAKDPEQRWQTGRDLHGELIWIRESASSVATPLVLSGKQGKRGRLARIVAGLFAVIAVAEFWLSWPKPQIEERARESIADRREVVIWQTRQRKLCSRTCAHDSLTQRPTGQLGPLLKRSARAPRGLKVGNGSWGGGPKASLPHVRGLPLGENFSGLAHARA
jgi:serine/threonine protein kinase